MADPKLNKKILIIEDEESVLDVYERELKYAGFDVVTAVDSDKGYKTAVKEMPDLILLDIMLPGASGLDLLKQLKNNDKTKDIQVAMLTNLDASAVIDEGYELGAEAYFVKSQFVPSQVSEEVKSLLGISDSSK